jgi:hypothetical protein
MVSGYVMIVNLNVTQNFLRRIIMSDCLYVFGSLLAFVGGINIYTNSSLLSGIIMLGIGGVIIYCGYLSKGLD